MSKEYQIVDEEGMLAFGAELATLCKPGDVIFLHGQLGAGKTTLVRGFLKSLGYTGLVKSPTYTLVEPYHIAGHRIFHFDLYRLKNVQELWDIGLEDYLISDAICLIEWPEKAKDILPKAAISCTIEICKEKGRKVYCSYC